MRVLHQFFVGETRHQRVGRRVAWTSAAEVALRRPGIRTGKAAAGRDKKLGAPIGPNLEAFGGGVENDLHSACYEYLPPRGGEV